MTLSTKKSYISKSAHQHVFPSPPFLSPQFLLISIVIVSIKVSLSNDIFAKLNLTVVVESINDSLEAVSLDHMPLLVSLPTHNVFPHRQVLQIHIENTLKYIENTLCASPHTMYFPMGRSCKYEFTAVVANTYWGSFLQIATYLLADPRNSKPLEVLISSNGFFCQNLITAGSILSCFGDSRICQDGRLIDGAHFRLTNLQSMSRFWGVSWIKMLEADTFENWKEWSFICFQWEFSAWPLQCFKRIAVDDTALPMVKVERRH